MKFLFHHNQQFEANEEKELKRSFDETILLTQAAGGEETMQAAKATRTNRRTDKKSGKFFDLERWGSFGKALRIGALVAKFALELLKKNTDDRNQLRRLGLNLLVRDVQEQHLDKKKQIKNKIQKQWIRGSINQLQPPEDHLTLPIHFRHLLHNFHIRRDQTDNFTPAFLLYPISSPSEM